MAKIAVDLGVKNEQLRDSRENVEEENAFLRCLICWFLFNGAFFAVYV